MWATGGSRMKRVREKDEPDQDLSGQVRLELPLSQRTGFYCHWLGSWDWIQHYTEKSNTESTLDGPRMLARKLDTGWWRERGARGRARWRNLWGEVFGVVLQSSNWFSRARLRRTSFPCSNARRKGLISLMTRDKQKKKMEKRRLKRGGEELSSGSWQIERHREDGGHAPDRHFQGRAREPSINTA